MLGKFGKQYRFKEMKLYSLDLNGEYSGDREYLTVELVRKRERWAGE